MKTKINTSISFVDDYHIIEIISLQKAYTLTYMLNKTFNLHLSRIENFSIYDYQGNVQDCYILYKECTNLPSTPFLLKSETPSLLPTYYLLFQESITRDQLLSFTDKIGMLNQILSSELLLFSKHNKSPKHIQALNDMIEALEYHMLDLEQAIPNNYFSRQLATH